MTTMLLNNRYQVLQVLGAGGFGETFLAEDTHMPSRRCCAIKQLKTTVQNPQTYQLIQKRFEREAVTLELLGKDSDQIPKLYAYFSQRSQFYIVQELIHGQTLTDIIEATGYLDEIAVTQVIVSLLEVLDYVHSKGIIHRDIKPDNIIIRSADGKPVLIDFGAVKETIRLATNTPGHPTSSLIIGTPGYMPSEQTAGRPVYATDIYSLGLTAIYLLTGKSPQELQSNQQTGEILWQHHAPNISPHLAKVLSQAIKPNAGDRFSTASKMLFALRLSSPNSTAPQFTAKSTQATRIITPLVNPFPANRQQKPTSFAVTVHSIMILISLGITLNMVGQIDKSLKVPVVTRTPPTPLPLILTEPADKLVASRPKRTPVLSNSRILKIPKYSEFKPSQLPEIIRPASVTFPSLPVLPRQHSSVVSKKFKLPVVTKKTSITLPLILTQPVDKLVISRPKRTPVLSNSRIPKIPKYSDLKPSKLPEVTRPAGVTFPSLPRQHLPVVSKTRDTKWRLELQQEIERLRDQHRDRNHTKQQPIPLAPSKLQIILSPSPTSIISAPKYPNQIESPESPPESPLIERLRKSRKASFTQTSH